MFTISQDEKTIYRFRAAACNLKLLISSQPQRRILKISRARSSKRRALAQNRFWKLTQLRGKILPLIFYDQGSDLEAAISAGTQTNCIRGTLSKLAQNLFILAIQFEYSDPKPVSY